MPSDTQLAEDYARLSPDLVISAVESTGRLSDARILALNSYENRVYQVGIEDDVPLIAKFYRPHRWSDEQLREEHAFARELAAAELPIVAPLADDQGETLFSFQNYRFALFNRKGGPAPEPGDLDTLYRLGQLLGRVHAIGQSQPFLHRPALTLARYFDSPRELLQQGFIPTNLQPSYQAITTQLRSQISDTPLNDVCGIRTQGDCHPGNIIWTRDHGPWMVDFDDCQSAPAVQDLWMLLTGTPQEQAPQLAELLDGYTQFCDFDNRELSVIEALRSLRMVHYAGWLASRWSDPAFPRYFPWFNSERYWQQHISELEEQSLRMAAPPLRPWG